MTQKLRTIRLLFLFRKRTPKGACLRLSYTRQKMSNLSVPARASYVCYGRGTGPRSDHRQRRRRLRGLHCDSLRPPTSFWSSLFASCVPHPLSIADHAQIPQRARFSHSYSYLSLTEPKRQYRLTNLVGEDHFLMSFPSF